MKKNILNNLILLSCLSVLLLASCEKVDKVTELGSSASYIQFFGIGGMEAGFTNSAVTFDDPSADTGYFENIKLQLSTSQVFGNDVQVTLVVDTSMVSAYNNAIQPQYPYEVMPDSLYSLITNTVTMKAGTSISEPIAIEFYPVRVDGSKNYMLPVKIASISGGSIAVAPGTGTCYFHIIGNPLAGNYISNGYFYHPSVPRAITNRPKFLAPVTPTQLLVELGDLGGGGYYSIFETDPVTNKVTILEAVLPLTQFDTELPNSSPGYTPQWPSSAECTNIYDPATKTFKVRYGYLGGATGTVWRVTEEILVKE
jgi:hypothetical protein